LDHQQKQMSIGGRYLVIFTH